MKSSTCRSLSLVAVFSAVAAIAQAHPGHAGHEGGDVTWDFSHLAAHPFATLGIVALVAGGAWLVWHQVRAQRAEQAQSLRKSTDNR